MTMRAMLTACLLAAAWPAGARAEAAAAEAGGQAEEAEYDARVGRVEGDVKVSVAGAEEDKPVAAKQGMPLESGDTLVAGPKSRAEVTLDPDNVVELGPGSSLKVESLLKKDCALSLALGHLVAKMKMLLGRRFRVRTPSAVAAVRGTEFAVEVVDGEDGGPGRTVAGVFDDGKLSVASLDDETGAERILTQDEEAEFFKGKPPGAVRRLAFLKARKERVERLRGRIKQLRDEFKQYSRENRQRIREQMRGFKEEIHRKMEERELRPKDFEERIKKLKQERREGKRKKGFWK